VKNTAASAPSASVAAAKPASSVTPFSFSTHIVLKLAFFILLLSLSNMQMKFAPTLNSAPRVRGVQGPDPMAALKQVRTN
jgi:hypothetical protein